MIAPSDLLSALRLDLPKQNRSLGKLPSLLFSDVLLIVAIGFGLLVVLALGIYLWMKWRRKRRRHVSGGERVYRGERELGNESAGATPDPAQSHHNGHHSDDEDEDEDDSDHSSRRRYKYRVRRRTHRSRNPTLSETGGLPPVKSPESNQPT